MTEMCHITGLTLSRRRLNEFVVCHAVNVGLKPPWDSSLNVSSRLHSVTLVIS